MVLGATGSSLPVSMEWLPASENAQRRAKSSRTSRTPTVLRDSTSAKVSQSDHSTLTIGVGLAAGTDSKMPAPIRQLMSQSPRKPTRFAFNLCEPDRPQLVFPTCWQSNFPWLNDPTTLSLPCSLGMVRPKFSGSGFESVCRLSGSLLGLPGGTLKARCDSFLLRRHSYATYDLCFGIATSDPPRHHAVGRACTPLGA